MISFTARIQKFDKKGEKTGWSYIEISARQAQQLKPKTKTSFRVKGSLDNFKLEMTALLPMGDGRFILPINARIRKATGKRQGDSLKVKIEVDDRKIQLSPDLIACLKDEPPAYAFFKTLPGSHQKYFSNWIESAKTSSTKSKRILMAILALSKKKGYAEMIRANKTG